MGPTLWFRPAYAFGRWYRDRGMDGGDGAGDLQIYRWVSSWACLTRCSGVLHMIEKSSIKLPKGPRSVWEFSLKIIIFFITFFILQGKKNPDTVLMIEGYKDLYGCYYCSFKYKNVGKFLKDSTQNKGFKFPFQ